MAMMRSSQLRGPSLFIPWHDVGDALSSNIDRYGLGSVMNCQLAQTAQDVYHATPMLLSVGLLQMLMLVPLCIREMENMVHKSN